jgi:hypothetical protein
MDDCSWWIGCNEISRTIVPGGLGAMRLVGHLFQVGTLISRIGAIVGDELRILDLKGWTIIPGGLDTLGSRVGGIVYGGS